MASEAVTCGDKMGGTGDEVGSVGALDSPSCGDVEVAEGAVTRERSSIPLMTLSDLDMTLNPVQRLKLQVIFKYPNFDDAL